MSHPYLNIYEPKNHVAPAVSGKLPCQKCLDERIAKLTYSRDSTIRGANVFLGKTKRVIELPGNKQYPIKYLSTCRINNNKTIINQRPKQEAAILGKLERNWFI